MLSSNILFIPTQFFFSPVPFRLHRFHSILQGEKLIHCTCRIIIKVTSQVNLWYHKQYTPVQWCTFFLYIGALSPPGQYLLKSRLKLLHLALYVFFQFCYLFCIQEIIRSLHTVVFKSLNFLEKVL